MRPSGADLPRDKPSVLAKPTVLTGSILKLEVKTLDTTDSFAVMDTVTSPPVSLKETKATKATKETKETKETIAALPNDLYAPTYTIIKHLTPAAHTVLWQAYQQATRSLRPTSTEPMASRYFRKKPVESFETPTQARVATQSLKEAAQLEGLPVSIINAAFANTPEWTFVPTPLSFGSVIMAMLEPIQASMERQRQLIVNGQPAADDALVLQLLQLCDAQDGQYDKSVARLKTYTQRRDVLSNYISNLNAVHMSALGPAASITASSMTIEIALQRVLKACVKDTLDAFKKFITERGSTLTERNLFFKVERYRRVSDAWLLYDAMRSVVFSKNPTSVARLEELTARETDPPFQSLLADFMDVWKNKPMTRLAYDTYNNYEQLEQAVLQLQLHQMLLERHDPSLKTRPIGSQPSEPPEPPDPMIPSQEASNEMMLMDPRMAGMETMGVMGMSSPLRNGNPSMMLSMVPGLSTVSMVQARNPGLPGSSSGAYFSDATEMPAPKRAKPPSQGPNKRPKSAKASSNTNSSAQPTTEQQIRTAQSLLQEMRGLMNTMSKEPGTNLVLSDALKTSIKKMVPSDRLPRMTPMNYKTWLEMGKMTKVLGFAYVNAMIDSLNALYNAGGASPGSASTDHDAPSSDATEAQQTMVAALIVQYKDLLVEMRNLKESFQTTSTTPSIPLLLEAESTTQAIRQNAASAAPSTTPPTAPLAASPSPLDALLNEQFLNVVRIEQTRNSNYEKLHSKLFKTCFPIMERVERVFPALGTMTEASWDEFQQLYSDLLKTIEGDHSFFRMQSNMDWLNRLQETQLNAMVSQCVKAVAQGAKEFGLPVDDRFLEAVSYFTPVNDDNDDNDDNDPTALPSGPKEIAVPSFERIGEELYKHEKTLADLDIHLDRRSNELAAMRDQIDWLLSGLQELEARVTFYDWNTPPEQEAPSHRVYMILQPYRALRNAIGRTVHGRIHNLDDANLEAQFNQANEHFASLCSKQLPLVMKQVDEARAKAASLCDQHFGKTAFEARAQEAPGNLYHLMDLVQKNPLKMGSRLGNLQTRLEEIVALFKEARLPAYYYAHVQMAVTGFGTEHRNMFELHTPDHPYVESEMQFQMLVAHIGSRLKVAIDALVSKAKSRLNAEFTAGASTVRDVYMQRNQLRLIYARTLRFYEEVDQLVIRMFGGSSRKEPASASTDTTDTTDTTDNQVLKLRLEVALEHLRNPWSKEIKLKETKIAMQFMTSIGDVYKRIFAQEQVDDSYFEQVESVHMASQKYKLERLQQTQKHFKVLLTAYKNQIATYVPKSGSQLRKAPASTNATHTLPEDNRQVSLMLVDLYKDLLLLSVEGVYSVNTGDALQRRILQKMSLAEGMPFLTRNAKVFKRDVYDEIKTYRLSQTLETARREELPYLSEDAPAFSLAPYVIDSPLIKNYKDLDDRLMQRVLNSNASTSKSALWRCYDAINRISTVANLVSLTRLRTQAGLRFRSPEVVFSATETSFEYADEALVVAQFVQDTVSKICTEIDNFAKMQGLGVSFSNWMIRLEHYRNALELSRQSLPTSSLLREEFALLEQLFQRAMLQDQLEDLSSLPSASDRLSASTSTSSVGMGTMPMDLTEDSMSPALAGDAIAEAQDEGLMYQSTRLFDEWDADDAKRLDDASPLITELLQQLQGRLNVGETDTLRAQLVAQETHRRRILHKERTSPDGSLLITWRNQFQILSERLMLNAIESALGASQIAHSCLIVLFYMLQAVDSLRPEGDASERGRYKKAIDDIDALYTGNLATFVAFERDVAAYEMRRVSEMAQKAALTDDPKQLNSYASAAALMQRQDLTRMLRTELTQEGAATLIVDPSQTLEDMGLPSILMDETRTMIDVAKFDSLLENPTDFEKALRETTLLRDLADSFPAVQEAIGVDAGVQTDVVAQNGVHLTNSILEACMEALGKLREGEFILARISTQESFEMTTLMQYMLNPLRDLIDQVASIDMVRWRYRDESNYLIEQAKEVHLKLLEAQQLTDSGAPAEAPSLNGLMDTRSRLTAVAATGSTNPSEIDEEWLTDDEDGQRKVEARLVAHPSGAMEAAAGVAHNGGMLASMDEQRMESFFGIGDAADASTKLTEHMSNLMSAGVVSMLEPSMKMHITPVAALTEYFNMADELLSGDTTYNYFARVCRPLFSPFRAGVLHAASLEEAVQIAFVYAFLHSEAQLWKMQMLATTRQDEEAMDEYEEYEEGDELREGSETGSQRGRAFADEDPRAMSEMSAISDGADSDEPMEGMDEASPQDVYSMPTFLASCYNAHSFMQQSSRMMQRVDVAKNFGQFPAMMTKMRKERAARGTDLLGKLPVDLLSARAPVQFAIPSATPNELVLVRVQTIVMPSAKVPADIGFDEFRTNYSSAVRVERVATTEEDLRYAQAVSVMYNNRSSAVSHYPHVLTLQDAFGSSASGAPSDLSTQTTAPILTPVAPLERAVTVYATAPMAVGGATLNALLQEDLQGVPNQLKGLMGSANRFTMIDMSPEEAETKLDVAKAKVQTYIHDKRKEFANPNTYEGVYGGNTDLTPFRRTAHPIRVRPSTQTTQVTQIEPQSTQDDEGVDNNTENAERELVVRLKAVRLQDANPGRIRAAVFAFDKMASIRAIFDDLPVAKREDRETLVQLKNQLRISHVLQPFLSLRDARVQAYLQQASLYGRAVLQEKARLHLQAVLKGVNKPVRARFEAVGGFLRR